MTTATCSRPCKRSRQRGYRHALEAWELSRIGLILSVSAGEQQRLAFARLFLHSPKVAFLDDASSDLDAGNEARLYELLSQRIDTYVSVGHRTSLVKFHTYVLEFKDDRSWKLWRKDNLVEVG